MEALEEFNPICSFNQFDLSHFSFPLAFCNLYISIYFLSPSGTIHSSLPLDSVSCSLSRWDSWHTAGPEVSACLREQQCGAQYRQHTKHTLLQQQHSVAQDMPQGDTQPCCGTGKGLTVHRDWFVHFLPWKELFWGCDKKEKIWFSKKRKTHLDKSLCATVCTDKCTVPTLLVCNGSEARLCSLNSYLAQKTTRNKYEFIPVLSSKSKCCFFLHTTHPSVMSLKGLI